MIVEELQKAIQVALKSIGVEVSSVALEHPADIAHGDYSTNVALEFFSKVRVSLGPKLKKRTEKKGEVCARPRGQEGVGYQTYKGVSFHSPGEFARKIVLELEKATPLSVEKIEVAGPGFINFYLKPEFFAEEVKKVGEDFGKNKNLKWKKIMVEYTDPNPFKPFHIGHLMGNAIGESIARLIEAEGSKVVRACWQGDVGLHVAKAIWGAQQAIKKLELKVESFTPEDWGKAYVIGSFAYDGHGKHNMQTWYDKKSGDFIDVLTDDLVIEGRVKGEIDELNKTIFEQSDESVNELYKSGRRVCLDHFNEIYNVLGTKFDHNFYEGIEGRDGIPIVEQGLKDGVFEKSDGAVVYKGDETKGLHTRVFLTSKGLPTYEAKELGLNKAKFEKEPDLDESIIITANEQSDYFKVVLAAMGEVMPEVAEKTKHIAHGMMRFADSKMSSRKGNVITGEALLERVKVMVQEKIAERDMSTEEKARVAEFVAVGAIKYSILRQAIGGDIIFDFEKSISFEGDSGPYLQYSYVRAKSVLEKAKDVGIKPSVEVRPQQIAEIERRLYRFPEVVARAREEYQPHHITTYLTELAGVFNSWYANGKIVDTSDTTSPYKLALTEAFSHVMKNGLWLLGIKVPEKM